MPLPSLTGVDPAGDRERPPGADVLPTVVLVPATPPRPVPTAPRVVGPGRRERDYLHRLAELEDMLQYERERRRTTASELELSMRVEHGAQRRLDRIEGRLEESLARERRLATLLGALQRDNELLREQVSALEAAARPELPAATEPVRRGFWGRLLGGSRPRRRPRA